MSGESVTKSWLIQEADKSTLNNAAKKDSKTGPHSNEAITDIEKGTTEIQIAADEDGLIRIGWDGPEDPNNPKNFPFKRRWFITTVVSFYGIVSPLTTTMIVPAIQPMSESLGVTGSSKQNLLVSIYTLGYVVGPFVLGPMSEVYGRRPLLMISNIIFIVFNIGCSEAQTFSQMAAFRFLSGIGGAGPLNVGGGILGDLWKAEERGKASALYSLGPLLGPSIGPVAGGFIAANISWRWTFRIVIIVGSISAIIGAFLLPETYAPVLIQRKVQRMKKETGNNALISKFDKQRSTRQIIFQAFVRPILMITTQPILILLTLFQSIIFGTLYILYVTIANVFESKYNEKIEIASLNYLAAGLGFIVGRQIGTRLMDKFYKKLKSRNGGIGTPEMRLVILLGPIVLIPSGMILYGWSSQYKIFWLIPDIGLFLFGMGMMCVTFVINAYILDIYTLYAASALAGNNSVRSVFAFVFPLFAGSLYGKLGYGWGNTLLGLIIFFLGGIGTLLLYHYGPWLRARSPYAAGGGD